MENGRRKLISLHAPMLAAGVGSFLAPQQQSRTFNLEMEPYTEETKPERDWSAADEDDIRHLNAVYSFLRHWAAKVKLDSSRQCRRVCNVGPLIMFVGCCRSLTTAVRNGAGVRAKRWFFCSRRKRRNVRKSP